MLSDKEQKKEFKKKASQEPDKYYPTTVLKEQGFTRKKCKCGTYFWTTTEDDFCGDGACSGGFRFFEDNPSKEKLSYILVWQKFAALFKELGYTPIKRYPVVARWRADMDFVIASIADFQPYVVSGEVKPPANPLVVPQFCLRFGDIDNVGITGSHMTCFNMIGQHMFVSPEEWDQNRVFKDIKKWLNDGLGLPDDEIKFHEDAWAGGGNFGPSMEFFSRGVEIGNQVYMLYEQTAKGDKELKLKVLDMGMGMERCAWFSQGTATIYDATFPTVMQKLREKTKIEYDEKIMKKYVPFAGLLNLDETEDIDKEWKKVAKEVGIGVDELKEKVLPLAALYSIAEHARGLLIAISDGALPSNVGGGYNLRVILRRAIGFIDKYKWDIDLAEVAKWHAEYLKPLFPELSENLKDVKKIFSVEKEKYYATKEKSKSIIQALVEKGAKITEKKLVELYDSNGISPEMIVEAANALGKKVEVPEDFYMKVAERHEKKEIIRVQEEKYDVKGLPDTKLMFYEDDELDKTVTEFEAEVLKVDGKNVVLDLTFFYATSGGQDHDNGEIEGVAIKDVVKQAGIVVHVLAEKPKFKKGDKVDCKIDKAYRKQLTQHHTATHVVNAAAKKVLGNHINQAGAKKTVERAHLDITHYQSVSDDEVEKIEKEANKIVKKGIPVRKYMLPRDEAEKKFGMRIYQGGAVPGNTIRIVEIEKVDVEACGGTHVDNTKEIEEIKILKSTKIQDGIVRLFFTAGKATTAKIKEAASVVDEVAKLLGVKQDEIPARLDELFTKWKKAKKAVKKGKKIDNLELEKVESYEGDILAKSCEILRVQPEHLMNTVMRFLNELEEFKAKLK